MTENAVTSGATSAAQNAIAVDVANRAATRRGERNRGGLKLAQTKAVATKPLARNARPNVALVTLIGNAQAIRLRPLARDVKILSKSLNFSRGITVKSH